MQTRREFLNDVGRGIITAGVAIALPKYAHGLEYKGDEFVIDAGKVRGIYVYYGNLPSTGEYKIYERDLEFVSRAEVIRATPSFKEIEKDRVDRSSARYQILIAKASETAVRTIMDYGKDSKIGLILDADYITSREGEGAILSVPENYKGRSLDRIVSSLDSTREVTSRL